MPTAPATPPTPRPHTPREVALDAALDLPRFDLRYDDLVTNPEATVSTMLEFCGLPWEESCLAFDKNQRFVKTASYAQVRRPINRSGGAVRSRTIAQLDRVEVPTPPSQ